ncbi:MAG: hypothetical protein JNK64_15490 [Myxococcales bacterium]|nr:hypothetical protein [Myxococcales bacterium]
MIPNACNACGKVVLELAGQHERLDSYYLEAGGPPAESAGDWHSKCLRESTVGGAWQRARLRSFTDVRGYSVTAELEAWTVIADPRRGTRIGLATHGALLTLPRAVEVVPMLGGAYYRERTSDYNLHLPDRELIAEMQRALVRDGVCPMSQMFRRLDLGSCRDHPDVLADARFIHDEELREEWGPDWLSANAECNVFIPAELIPFCV